MAQFSEKRVVSKNGQLGKKDHYIGTSIETYVWKGERDKCFRIDFKVDESSIHYSDYIDTIFLLCRYCRLVAPI